MNFCKSMVQNPKLSICMEHNGTENNKMKKITVNLTYTSFLMKNVGMIHVNMNFL